MPRYQCKYCGNDLTSARVQEEEEYCSTCQSGLESFYSEDQRDINDLSPAEESESMGMSLAYQYVGEG